MGEPVQYNLKNSAVKRILQEIKEMKRDQSDDFMSEPLQDNMFEWHFAIRGPRDSEFEGGVYHGRIILPPEYPFKPPTFMLLSPNGRFETQTKICLSISQHHPEHWQPSWSVRTALVALIAFMPTKPDRALGSLDYTKEERMALAIKSRLNPPKFGSPERQQLIQAMHEAMLRKAPPVPDLPPATSPAAAPAMPSGSTPATDLPAAQGMPSETRSESAAAGLATPTTSSFVGPKSHFDGPSTSGQADRSIEGRPAALRNQVPSEITAEEGGSHLSGSTDVHRLPVPDVSNARGLVDAGAVSSETGGRLGQSSGGAEGRESEVVATCREEVKPGAGGAVLQEERWLTGLAMALAVAIFALLLRKLFKAYYSEDPEAGS